MLLANLTDFLSTRQDSIGINTKSKAWPQSPAAFGKELAGIAPNLRTLGIIVEATKTNKSTLYTIAKLPPLPPLLPPDENHAQNGPESGGGSSGGSPTSQTSLPPPSPPPENGQNRAQNDDSGSSGSSGSKMPTLGGQQSVLEYHHQKKSRKSNRRRSNNNMTMTTDTTSTQRYREVWEGLNFTMEMFERNHRFPRTILTASLIAAAAVLGVSSLTPASGRCGSSTTILAFCGRFTSDAMARV